MNVKLCKNCKYCRKVKYCVGHWFECWNDKLSNHLVFTREDTLEVSPEFGCILFEPKNHITKEHK